MIKEEGDGGICTYPRKETNHGLHLIPSHRVTNKGHGFALNNFKKLKRVENGKFTLIWLPSPLHELRIWSPILHAVLVFMNGPTSLVCV